MNTYENASYNVINEVNNTYAVRVEWYVRILVSNIHMHLMHASVLTYIHIRTYTHTPIDSSGEKNNKSTHLTLASVRVAGQVSCVAGTYAGTRAVQYPSAVVYVALTRAAVDPGSPMPSMRSSGSLRMRTMVLFTLSRPTAQSTSGVHRYVHRTCGDE